MQLDVARVKANADLVKVVSSYMELKHRGSEYVGLCPFHTDSRPSLWVIPQKGFYHCFACEANGDAIDFVREMEGCSFKDAVAKISDGQFTPSAPIKRPSEHEKRNWVSMRPPDDAPPPVIRMGPHEPTRKWAIKDGTGHTIGYSARYDVMREGEAQKIILQYTWGRFNDADTEPGWACRHFNNPTPFYGLDRLAANPKHQVLIFEGEKKADAGAELLPQFISLSWLGGAQKWRYVDISPLAGRELPIVIVGDCDQPGREAMRGLADRLLAAGLQVKIVVDETKPKGWDIADAKDDGWSGEQILEWIKAHAVPFPHVTGPAGAPEDDADGDGGEDSDLPPLSAYDDERGTEKPKLNGHDTLSAPTGTQPPHVEYQIEGDVHYRMMSEIEAKPIDWLWPGRFAKGKVSMIVGNPGLGKSQVCASLISVVSNGGRWPVDRTQCAPGSIIILSAEDDAEDTIKPRLEAAGAAMEKVAILDAVTVELKDGPGKRGFDLTTDVSRLGALCHHLGDVAMVIIDPITAYLGSADSHKNAEVRALLAQLSEMAAAQHVAVVTVSHLTKSSGMDALLRVQGSIGFAAAARAVWGVAKDKDNAQRRLFMPLKNNLGTDVSGFAYAVEGVRLQDSEIETSHVVWENQLVTISAEEAFASQSMEPGESGRLADAKSFLRDMLMDGPMMYSDIRKDAAGAGHKWQTIERAKDDLKVESYKDGFRAPWRWRLPPGASTSSDSRD